MAEQPIQPAQGQSDPLTSAAADGAGLPMSEAEAKSNETSLKAYRKKLRGLVKDLKALVEDRDRLVGQLDVQLNRSSEIVEEVGGSRDAASAVVHEIREFHSQAATALAEGETLRPKLNTLSQRCEEIELAAQQAAKRSSHIEDGFKYVQAKKPEVEVAVDKITEAKSKCDQLLSSSQASLAEVKAAAKASEAARLRAEESAGTVEEAVAAFSERNEEIEKQSARLEELCVEAESLRKTVNELLPGATSAGLASSFNKRADELVLSIRFWETVALLSLGGLVAFGLISGHRVLEIASSPNWTNVLVPVGVKAMIALPLVWLALFSARRGAITKRVQEDYRYKASIATAFEGFKNQFTDIESSEASPAYLLSKTVLASLTAQPGRLYDAKHQEVTPLSATAEAIAGLTKHRKGKIRAQGVEAEFEDTEPQPRQES